MKIEIIGLDYFNGNPTDEEVFRLAKDYAQKNLSHPDDPFFQARTWVACEVKDGKPVEVHGITGVSMVPDVPILRVTGPYAMQVYKQFFDRVLGYLADNGHRGREVMLYLADKELPEHRCANWEKAIKMFGAMPSERLKLKIK